AARRRGGAPPRRPPPRPPPAPQHVAGGGVGIGGLATAPHVEEEGPAAVKAHPPVVIAGTSEILVIGSGGAERPDGGTVRVADEAHARVEVAEGTEAVLVG